MNGRKLELVVSTDVGKLFEAAADGFLKPLRAAPGNPFPSPEYLLALRQGGLRDDLIRLAARKGCKGWFDPPLCIFHELPQWLGEPKTKALSDVERTALLGEVVRRVGGEVFGRSSSLDFFLESLDSFFGELVAEGVVPRKFETAAAAIMNEKGSFNARKNSELANIFGSYIAELEAAGVRDGRDSLVAAADIIAKQSEGFSARLGGRREIRFFGLADLRGGWRKLLHALAQSPSLDQVRIYTMREFNESELDGLPPVEIEYLSTETNISASLFRESEIASKEQARSRFSVFEAPNAERELGEVALEVRRLVVGGVPPHRIAVVARRGRPYVELAVGALKVAGVPATARLRIAFNEIPVVKAVLGLFAAASEGWTRSRLAEIAGFPHFLPLLDTTVLNLIGFRRSVRGLRAWETAIEDLRRETERASEAARDDSARSGGRPSVERVTEALRRFVTFQNLLGDLDSKRSLLEWIDWLDCFLTDDPLEIEKHIYGVPGSTYEPIKRDLAGWRGMQAISREWKEAVANWGDVSGVDPTNASKIPVGEFSKRLREMLDGQVGIWTETQRGVQVMEALAAAYREFDSVFLVGMEAGAFPLPAPRSPILDDDDRCAIGDAGVFLDTRSDWDSRERDLFRAVVSGAKHLTVSYPAIGTRGADSIRSSFVEALAENADEEKQPIDEHAVLTPGTPLVFSAAGKALASHAASIEYARQQFDSLIALFFALGLGKGRKMRQRNIADGYQLLAQKSVGDKPFHILKAVESGKRTDP